MSRLTPDTQRPELAAAIDPAAAELTQIVEVMRDAGESPRTPGDVARFYLRNIHDQAPAFDPGR
jgi:hypothetical protein